MQMCKINHAPLQVGSVVRNSGFGSMLMYVTAMYQGKIALRTYGRTNHGTFKSATQPRMVFGTLYAPDAVAVPGTQTTWIYQHVTPQWFIIC